ASGDRGHGREGRRPARGADAPVARRGKRRAAGRCVLAALLHDLEVRLPRGGAAPARPRPRGPGRLRSGRRRLLVREDHPVAVLAGVDPEHGVDRHLDALGYAGESGLEGHSLVAEHEGAGRDRTDVQDELAVDGMARRRDEPRMRRVDDDMGRHVVVQYPLVHRTEQIRALLGHPRYWRISCSISVRLAWNDGRENTSSMYRW